MVKTTSAWKTVGWDCWLRPRPTPLPRAIVGVLCVGVGHARRHAPKAIVGNPTVGFGHAGCHPPKTIVGRVHAPNSNSWSKGGSRLCRSLPSGRCQLCRSPRGSRLCRRKLSGRCRRCRSPRAVGEPLSAFRLQLACRSTRVVGMPLSACRCRPSGRSWLAAPLGLSACRCRLAAVGFRAAVGLPHPQIQKFATSGT